MAAFELPALSVTSEENVRRVNMVYGGTNAHPTFYYPLHYRDNVTST